jgi:phosphoglucosamine mutase
VDENGNLIDGDQIMAACAKFMRDNGTLKQNTLARQGRFSFKMHFKTEESGATAYIRT